MEGFPCANRCLCDRELAELGKRVEIIQADSSSQEAFLKDLEKHPDATIIYSTNGSKIGGFPKDTIDKMPGSIKYICHNGEYQSIERSLYLSSALMRARLTCRRWIRRYRCRRGYCQRYPGLSHTPSRRPRYRYYSHVAPYLRFPPIRPGGDQCA